MNETNMVLYACRKTCLLSKQMSTNAEWVHGCMDGWIHEPCCGFACRRRRGSGRPADGATLHRAAPSWFLWQCGRLSGWLHNQPHGRPRFSGMTAGARARYTILMMGWLDRFLRCLYLAPRLGHAQCFYFLWWWTLLGLFGIHIKGLYIVLCKCGHDPFLKIFLCFIVQSTQSTNVCFLAC